MGCYLLIRILKKESYLKPGYYQNIMTGTIFSQDTWVCTNKNIDNVSVSINFIKPLNFSTCNLSLLYLLHHMPQLPDLFQNTFILL